MRYQDSPDRCLSSSLYAVMGVDSMLACCVACSWLRIATMPATQVQHFHGHLLQQVGGMAGVEFGVQPVLNVSGVQYTSVEAILGNNPGCSELKGNTVASVIKGM
jgi:hypothetical protein